MPKYMAIYLDSRKNDQFRMGSWVFISRWSNGMCPVALVEGLIQKGGLSGHVKLFGKRLYFNSWRDVL